MASCESFLPIQDDSRFVTFRTDEAKVEEHFWSEVGTGKDRLKRKNGRNKQSIKSDRLHHWSRHPVYPLDYVLEAPAKCLQCGGAINEKTLVEWDVPVRNNLNVIWL
jgi:hypothetical protein